MEDYSRSDLACESDGFSGSAALSERVYREEKIGAHTVARLSIEDGEGERAFGKPKGTYVTISCGKIWLMSEEERASLVALMARELRAMCASVGGRAVDEGFGVLVAGLGNRFITSDALGTYVVNELFPAVDHNKIKFM